MKGCCVKKSLLLQISFFQCLFYAYFLQCKSKIENWKLKNHIRLKFIPYGDFDQPWGFFGCIPQDLLILNFVGTDQFWHGNISEFILKRWKEKCQIKNLQCFSKNIIWDTTRPLISYSPIKCITTWFTVMLKKSDLHNT